jgi:hypothetical protein
MVYQILEEERLWTLFVCCNLLSRKKADLQKLAMYQFAYMQAVH